jgi:cell division protein FtsB
MRRTLFDFAVTAVCLGLLGFFGWHGIYGERSLTKAEAIEVRVSALTDDLDRVRKQREELESRVRLLRPESVDPDLVEELARKVLGFTRDGDVLLPLGPGR